MAITATQLEKLGACADQIAKFRARFGEVAPATVEAAVSVAPDFNWDWIAAKTLKPQACTVYYKAVWPAFEAYEAACRPAGKAYDEAVRPFANACKAAMGAQDEAAVRRAKEARDYAVQQALEAYRAAERPAIDAYRHVAARAFAELYIAQEQGDQK